MANAHRLVTQVFCRRDISITEEYWTGTTSEFFIEVPFQGPVN